MEIKNEKSARLNCVVNSIENEHKSINTSGNFAPINLAGSGSKIITKDEKATPIIYPNNLLQKETETKNEKLTPVKLSPCFTVNSSEPNNRDEEANTADCAKKSIEIESKSKKKYVDKAFKIQLAKALKANFGEPDNFDKLKANKLLAQYESEKIVEYTNQLAKDIQTNVENSITSSNTKEIINLTKIVDSLTDGNKTHEIPLVVKLNSVSKTPPPCITNNVNFDALNKFLYTSVSGSLDCSDMNHETKLVLQQTYNMLMEQVEKDAPTVLNEFRSKMSHSPVVPETNEKLLLPVFFENRSLNPFNMPFDLLMQNFKSD